MSPFKVDFYRVETFRLIGQRSFPMTIIAHLEYVSYEMIQRLQQHQYHMLIPEFKLTQNNTHVTVSLRLPYVKVTACEFFIEEKEFKFFLKPYLLTLSFEQPLKTAQQPDKAIYYHQKYILEVMLLKKNEGQFFENLNLLTSVVGNKSKKKTEGKKAKVLVEVIGEQQHKMIDKKEVDPYSYGFCNNYKNVFKDLEEEVEELFFFNPETVPIPDRFEFGKKIAEEDFDESMYLFDKISNFQEIDRITASQQARKTVYNMLKSLKEKHPSTNYEKFKASMKIPSKQLIINKHEEPNIIKQLVSITIAYLYELECMQGQLSVQSPKTIIRTSAVFSCLNDFSHVPLDKVITETMRRCLTYSLYKHVDICRKVLEFLKQIMTVELLTAIILDLRQKFDKSECRYLLNRIFLDDYAVYLLAGKGPERVQRLLKEEKIVERIIDSEIGLNEETLNLDVELNEELEMSSSNVGGQLEELLKLD